MSQHIDPPMNQASIVDNLTTNDGTKALSAAQGYALNSKLYIKLEGGSSYWATNIAKLNTMANEESRLVYITGGAMEYITSNLYSVSGKGVVAKTMSGLTPIYDLLLMVGVHDFVLIRLNNPNSSSLGTVTIDSITDKITTDTFTSSDENIAAGERKTITIPISKTGYTPIGIVSLYTPETQVMAFTTFYINGSNVVVGLYNTYHEIRNGKTVVRVLFLKN